MEHKNDTTKVPAAACGGCGGWSSMGGMSQYRNSTVPVLGRTGCTCGKILPGASAQPPRKQRAPFTAYKDLMLPRKQQWRATDPMGRGYPTAFTSKAAAEAFLVEARKLDSRHPQAVLECLGKTAEQAAADELDHQAMHLMLEVGGGGIPEGKHKDRLEKLWEAIKNFQTARKAVRP